jgi:hypothetical protein
MPREGGTEEKLVIICIGDPSMVRGTIRIIFPPFRLFQVPRAM